MAAGIRFLDQAQEVVVIVIGDIPEGIDDLRRFCGRVVTVEGFRPQRITLAGDDAPLFVIGIGYNNVAQRVSDGKQLMVFIVGVGCGVATHIGGSDKIAGNVIGKGDRPANRVDNPSDSPICIVGEVEDPSRYIGNRVDIRPVEGKCQRVIVFIFH